MAGIFHRVPSARISDRPGRNIANALVTGEEYHTNVYYTFDAGAFGVVAGQVYELYPKLERGISENRQINLSQYGAFEPFQYDDRLSFLGTTKTVAANGTFNALVNVNTFDNDGTVTSAGGVLQVVASRQGNAAAVSTAFVAGSVTVAGAAPVSLVQPPAGAGGFHIPVYVTPTAGDITAGRVFEVVITNELNFVGSLIN